MRASCFSSDNTAVMSVSLDSVKIWNRATAQCIRTMQCSKATSCVFAPGDRHVVVGTESGALLLFNIAAGVLLETVQAHSDKIVSVCLAPDKV